MEFNSNKKCFIKVWNEEHSKLIQKMLFSIGIEWRSVGKSISFADEPILIIEDKYVSYTLLPTTNLIEKGYEEIDMDWLVPEKKRETVDIPGFGRFYKDQLEEALDTLDRVE